MCLNPLEFGWVVYGPENGYNFPYPLLLRGGVLFSEIVFVGQCEVFVFLDFGHFFFFIPLAAKVIGPQTGCQFFKKCLFFSTCPLNP